MTNQLPNIGDIITYRNRHNEPVEYTPYPDGTELVVTGVFIGGVTVEGSEQLVYHFYYDVKEMVEHIAAVPLKKTELLESLKSIEWDDFLPVGTEYLGNISEVYAEFQHDDYRIDIWEIQPNVRIATWDRGNGSCSFVCDGALDVLKPHLVDLVQKRRDAIARPGDLVMFPVTPELAHVPNIHDFTFKVEHVSEQGITIAGYDTVFPHDTYII